MMSHHRYFGFPASSPPPSDEDREGAVGALPAARRPRLTPRGMETIPAAWPRYVLDPGAPSLRREPAASPQQLRGAEDALAAFSRRRRRADRRDTWLMIGAILAAIALLLLAPAVVP